jgi:hypothetical protein
MGKTRKRLTENDEIYTVVCGEDVPRGFEELSTGGCSLEMKDLRVF